MRKNTIEYGPATQTKRVHHWFPHQVVPTVFPAPQSATTASQPASHQGHHTTSHHRGATRPPARAPPARQQAGES